MASIKIQKGFILVLLVSLLSIFYIQQDGVLHAKVVKTKYSDTAWNTPAAKSLSQFLPSPIKVGSRAWSRPLFPVINSFNTEQLQRILSCVMQSCYAQDTLHQQAYDFRTLSILSAKHHPPTSI